MSRRLMTGPEIREALETLPGWTVADGALTQTLTFADFVGSIRFVNEAANIAEELDHHPDMDIRYNRVLLRLSTHDAGGLTGLDFELARRLSAVQQSEGV